MGYSIDQDLEIMKEIERISQEPVNESQYTAVRHGGKPIVESMAVFDDVKVDFNKWTSDNKKVHKAKTVNTGSAKPITKNDTVEEKKKDGQVTEVKNVEMTKKKEQVVEAKQESDGDKAKPAPEVKNFDSKAKSAAASNRAGADKEKHFAEVAKKQKKFKAFIESLVVDEASRQAADTVLAEAEKVFKAQFEAIGGGDVVGDGRVETGAYGVNGYTEFNDGWGDSEIVRQSDKAMVLAPTLNAYLNRHGFTGDTWGKWTQEEFDQCFDEAHNNKPFGGQYSAKI